MKAAFPILFLSFIIISCTGSSRLYKKKTPSIISQSNIIRVLLDDNINSKVLSFKNPVILRSEQQNICDLSSGSEISISGSSGSIRMSIGRKSYNLQQLDIYPSGQESFVNYKNRNYRGILRIKYSGRGISVINVLPLEDYLKGVMYPEMGVASRPAEFEALKAFAICIRNYASMKLKQNGSTFDVYADSRDQHYTGMDSEKPYCSRAVDETRGMMLMYNKQPAQVFYFSSCGGHTENSDNIFPQKGLEYMRGVEDGNEPYCSISPSFTWEENYSGDDIVNYLKTHGLIDKSSYSVSNIEISSRFESGRVNELSIRLEDDSGRSRDVVLKGNPIRSVIKSKVTKGILKSTMFDLSPVYRNGALQKLQIKGRGNGHGAGLCQWGSIAQSRQGKNFNEILRYYFPGTRVEKL